MNTDLPPLSAPAIPAICPVHNGAWSYKCPTCLEAAGMVRKGYAADRDLADSIELAYCVTLIYGTGDSFLTDAQKSAVVSALRNPK